MMSANCCLTLELVRYCETYFFLHCFSSSAFASLTISLSFSSVALCATGILDSENLDRLQGGHDGLEAVPQALGLSFILHDVSSGLKGRADERDDGVDDHDGAISLWEEGWGVGRSSCADPAPPR